MTQTFTRMDQSTAEEWACIGEETVKEQYDTLPLEHFEPLVRKVFAAGRLF
jgi:hypothetical protein